MIWYKQSNTIKLNVFKFELQISMTWLLHISLGTKLADLIIQYPMAYSPIQYPSLVDSIIIILL